MTETACTCIGSHTGNHFGDCPQAPTRGGSGGPAELRQRAGGGETNEWYTPPEIFHALDCEFAMDVAAPYGGLPWIPAKRFLSHRDDGLSVPWEGRVWLNPPYGPHTAPWLGRIAAHGDGIALVFARTDVAWFHTIAPQASLISFVKGRISFVRGIGIERNGHNSAAPSCLMAFGDECADIVRRSNLGLCGVLTCSALESTKPLESNLQWNLEHPTRSRSHGKRPSVGH